MFASNFAPLIDIVDDDDGPQNGEVAFAIPKPGEWPHQKSR